ncbi:dipeptidase [Methylobacterium planeticum]|uniref:Membrane dipeptidase n=1 Tax=Methylobacterium planeticum TaxID=2615211 RepID=A0A6N6MSY8_9HYPH|nr:dipeptidase [Methylobacterium planeticum]KAB1073503.1 membrane dipeptidase [Methylobacterium planeticum]
MSSRHEDLIVIDGLIVSDFGPEVFADMRRGGITAANCTCSVWEDFATTMRAVARWRRWFREHADLIAPIHTAADIRRVKAEGRTGIIHGWQNTSAIEDRLEYLELFHALGLRIVQLTYNTQNLVGSGCYESHDGGLSDFGREVLAEMNRLGILCDLSHVGSKTSEDAIRASTRRVAYSHCLPAALKAHPRNKTDAQLRFIAEHGGFVGVTMFPPFLARGPAATIEDYVDAIAHVIACVGEENVGIGTDFTQGYGRPFFDYITHDKGYGRKLTEFGEILNPEGIRTIGEFPNLTAAMERRGWSDRRIERVMGGNWLALLDDVWA